MDDEIEVPDEEELQRWLKQHENDENKEQTSETTPSQETTEPTTTEETTEEETEPTTTEETTEEETEPTTSEETTEEETEPTTTEEETEEESSESFTSEELEITSVTDLGEIPMDIPTDAEFNSWAKKQASPEENRLKLMLKVLGSVIVIVILSSIMPDTVEYITGGGTPELRDNYQVFTPLMKNFKYTQTEKYYVTFVNRGLEPAQIVVADFFAGDAQCKTNVTLPAAIDAEAQWQIMLTECIPQTSTTQTVNVEISGTTTRRSVQAGSFDMYVARMKRIGADNYQAEKSAIEKLKSAASRENSGENQDFISTGTVEITVI